MRNSTGGPRECYVFDMLDYPTVRNVLLTRQQDMTILWNGCKGSLKKECTVLKALPWGSVI